MSGNLDINVDIYFSVYDAFLEKPSMSTFKVKRSESQINEYLQGQKIRKSNQ
jgi:hypothetical protein